MLTVRRLTVEDFIRRFHDGKPVAFPRYHDGDWRAVLRIGGAMEHSFIGAMADELAETIHRPHISDDYWYGICPFISPKCHDLRNRVYDWLNDTAGSEATWVDSVVLQDAWQGLQFGPILRELRKRKCLMIGPEFLQDASTDIFNPYKRIFVRRKDCWHDLERVEAELLDALDNDGVEVVSFSAASMTNILIWRHWPKYRDRVFLLDLGSMWDICAGERTRGRFKGDWDNIIKINLERSNEEMACTD